MKLEGVKVLDLSLFLPGPHLTLMMADHGADVIKVEPPGEGEPARNLGYQAGGTSTWFRNTHRGKRSVQLNLKDETHREAFYKLAEWADVMVEAFRPGVVDRLGIGYDTIAAKNPGIVYASIAAFGQTGPLRDLPAHDLAIEGHAGVLSLNLGRDGFPASPHMPVADLAGSLMALSGILMALYRRETTGRGDYMDMSMMDATMSWLPNVTGPVFAEDRAPVVKAERSFGGNAFFHIYETKDRRQVVLGGVERKFVKNLLTALGREDFIDLATSGAGLHQDPLRAFLSETFASRTRDEWVEWFEGRDIAFAPVLDLYEAFHAPHVKARDMLVTDEDGNLHIGIPIKFRDEPGRIEPSVPELAADNEEALRQAGCEEGVIEAVLGKPSVQRTA